MKLFLFILAGVFTLQSCNTGNKKKLPILGNREPVEHQVNGKTVIDTIYQTIPSFSYLNQDSIIVTDKDFEGKISVVLLLL